MLQRQRALRKQQQTKQQSAKQLPPKGQSSADSRQARGQRTTTAKAQAANQQRVIARGMEGFIRRGKAQDKLDAAAKGTQGTGTRTAGAGGGLATTSKPIGPRRQLPASSQSSGRPRTGNSSQPWGNQPVRKVKVQDLGSPNQLGPGPNGGQRSLPPSQQGPQQATRLQTAQAKLDRAAKGSTGPNRVGQPAGAANRRYGANVVNNAVTRAQQATRLGKNLSVGRLGGAAALLGMANAVDDARLTDKQRTDKYKVVDPNRGQRLMDNVLSGNKPKPITKGNAQSRFAGARDANLNRINNDPKFAAPAAKAKAPAPTQSGGGSTQSRSGGGSSRPAAPAPRRQPGPAADAGMKNQDKNYRGNVFEKTFGYKAGQAPDQQKARFKSVDNKFGQDSGYEAKTKVDGSKYADKKPDMKKVNEYDRLRKKYHS
jgi:hypothetical protein